jgi:hypothetical protein
MAGDNLVAAAMWEATRATTIDAAPEAVWPWLVQMGFSTHRAGWYMAYWLDRALFGVRAHSSDRIVPELQHLAVGDRVLDGERGNPHFTVAIVEPPHVLMLHSHTTRCRSTATPTSPGVRHRRASRAHAANRARPDRLHARLARRDRQGPAAPWVRDRQRLPGRAASSTGYGRAQNAEHRQSATRMKA